MRLSDYFDKKLNAEFEDAVPVLRKQLGQRRAGDWGSGYGVAGNTFRALGGYTKAPSPVYQEWAAKQLRGLNGQSVYDRAQSRDTFVKWHSSLVAGLEDHWNKAMQAPLSFAHSRKLVDLFIKWLSHFDFGSIEITDALVSHANCALDRQTLKKLNACLSEALPMSSPSMGDVASESTYRFCQAAITEFAQSAGGTRLLFDCFGWKRGG
jgi:hypothetical protein